MVTERISDVSSLQQRIAGRVFSRPDDGLVAEISPFNASVAHRPAVVVGAASTADVQAAVRWAAKRDLSVGVQATGHGATSPYDSGLVVSTRRLAGLTVDPDARTAHVGAGVRWREVVDAAAAHGLAPLNGSSSDVGAIGFTVGGGLPVLGRTYGWASDLARSFELVNAEGDVVTASRDENLELFTALRGGKPDIGIVTAMTVELVPVHMIVGGAIFYPGDAARRVLDAYRDWSAELPNSWTTALKLLRLPPLPEVPEPLRGRLTVQLAVAFVGDVEEAVRTLRPMRAVAPSIIDAVGPMAYPDVDLIHRDPDHPVPVNETTVVLPALTTEALDRIDAIAGAAASCPFLMVELRQLGGALGRPPRVPDSVGVRDASHVLLFLGALLGPVASSIPGALIDAVATMAPVSTGGTFVNMHGTATTPDDAARAWPAAIAERLRRVKAEWDPENRFRFQHSLVSAPDGGSSDRRASVLGSVDRGSWS